jgi:D-alanyl-D-alanine carboxypeptidase (penicillin-binding protein 5/6)
MGIASRLALGAVIAGLVVAGSAIAPARAAATRGTSATATPAAAAAPVGVGSRWAELANAATGADLWSRSSVLERPMGSVTKVMTAYVVLTAPGLNLKRVITVPSGIVAYDDRYDASTAGLRPGEKLTTLQLLYG